MSPSGKGYDALRRAQIVHRCSAVAADAGGQDRAEGAPGFSPSTECANTAQALPGMRQV